MAITMTVDGKNWDLPCVAAILAGYKALAPETRPRVLLGCERCKRVCTRWDLCRCCTVYKTKSGGGATIFWPDDGRGHVGLMPMDLFIERARELRGAA